MCARRPASLAVVPAVCLRGSGCRCAGGVAAFVGPSGCVPFVLRAPSASLGPSGRLSEGGSSPFVCASLWRPRTLVWRVTPLIGEGSLGPGVRARAYVSIPSFFVSRPFLAIAWVPLARVGGPPLCHRPSPGRAPSAVVTPSWSISLPVCVLACAAPGSCRVYDFLCARFRSRVFVNVRARPVLCFLCLTSAPPVFVRMAVESGGGFPPRSRPGWGKNPALPPPSSREHPPSPDAGGKGETEAGLANYFVVLTTSGVACRASLFWGRNEGGAKGQKLSQGVGEFWLVPVQSAFS